MTSQIDSLIIFEQKVPNGTINFKFKFDKYLEVKIQVVYQTWTCNITNTFSKEYLIDFIALPIQGNPSLLFSTCMNKNFFSKEQIKMFGMEEKKPQKSLISSKSKDLDTTSSTSARSNESSSISPPMTARETEKIEKLAKTLSGSSISRSTSNLDQQKTRERKDSKREKRKSRDSKRNSKNLSIEGDLKNNSSSTFKKSSSGSSSDSKSPRYISPRRTNDNSPNDSIKSSLELEKKCQIKNCVPLIVWGKTLWETWIGKIGDEPRLPFDVSKIKYIRSPFWDETYGETNYLMLIPSVVNEILLNPKSFEELMSKNKSKPVPYSYHCAFEDNEKTVSKSYWAFITQGPVPETFNKSHSDSLKIIAEKISLFKNSVELSNNSHEVPNFIEVGLSIFIGRFYNKNPYANISTRCQEKVMNNGRPSGDQLAIDSMNNHYGEVNVKKSIGGKSEGQTVVVRFHS